MATRKIQDGLEMSKVYCHEFVRSTNDILHTISSTAHAKDVLYGILFVVALMFAVKSYLDQRQKRQSATSRPSTPTTLEKAPSSKFAQPTRKPGVWEPSSFRMPTPPPYPDWSIETTKPLPYRPFRYGPKYNVTMGLRNAKHHDWIELDNQFPKFHADKAQRITERGSKCCKTDPAAFPAALELLEDLTHYLPARYPTLYRRTPTGLTNLSTNETFTTLTHDIFTTTVSPSGEDPIQTAARLLQDDLAIMIESPTTGDYHLLSGAILLAGFWRLSDKFGMSLSEIHTSGDVPEFRTKLEKGMTNFFRRLKPADLVARNNYFVQVDDRLAWSTSIGAEDSDGIGWNTAQKDRAVSHHWFRSERQTLRRLPRSGGVVFTIRTYFHPITEICDEDYVPGRLASAVRSWGDDVGRYKGKEKYGDVLLEYLDRRHGEQVAKGLDLTREDEVRAYPY